MVIQPGVDAETLSPPGCGRDSVPLLSWIVAHTHPHREQWAADNLTRAGYEVFCPKWTVLIGTPPRPVGRPLFRSYAFVALEPRQGWVAARYTPGVHKLCMAGDRPSLVPHASIVALLAGEERRLRPPGLDTLFEPGTPVGLSGGSPLDGIDAVVLDVDGDNSHVQVLMFGELRVVSVKTRCLVLRRD